MSSKSRKAVLLALLMLSSVLVVAQSALAEMEAPTLSGTPAIDGSVEGPEWGIAPSYTFSSPRSGTSTIRVGYLDDANQLALGLVLSDGTIRDSGDEADMDRVEILVSADPDESPQSYTDNEDWKYVIYRDGSWEVYRGHTNQSIGFSSGTYDSGTQPSGTDTNRWRFAVSEGGTSWTVEALFNIGNFKAGDRIALGLRQHDVNEDDELKSATRPSGLSDKDPTKWERTTLTGRPNTVRLSVSPSKQEAGVGGDIIVTLPADASGGLLTVQTKGPGEGGFTPIGPAVTGQAGPNRFHFAPLKTGSWNLQAVWQGDGNYGESTAQETITVSRPSLTGDTVLETGSLRVAFPMEDEGAPAEWRYLNTVVTATDDGNDQLSLVRLDSTNSCRKEPMVGFANMDEEDGGLELHFEPAVRRAALALTSPQGQFSANIQAYKSDGGLKEEVNTDGSCSTPAFASLGDTQDDVKRIEIEYSGSDEREVVDVVFPHPLTSTAPQTVVRTIPSPMHAGGAATLDVAAGSPHRLTRAQVTVTSGSSTLETRTCNAAPAQVWIDCPVDIEIPSTASSVTVSIRTTDRDGNQRTRTHTLELTDDVVAPEAQLLPSPLMAGQGAAVGVHASATDASGIAAISVQAVDEAGDLLNEKTCEPTSLSLTYACVLGVTPPSDGVAYVTATFKDEAGNERSLGPKPLPVRGPDKDGDGLPDALELKIGTSPNVADTDDDGLPDGWEVVGVDRNGDGEAEIDLAALGADPQVRDIFMEIDWTERAGQSYKPAYGSIQLVRNVLLSHGIRLHVDAYHQGGPFDPSRYDHGHAAHRSLIDDGRAGIFMHVLAGEMGGPAASGGWTIYLPLEPTRQQSQSAVGAQLLRQIGTLLEIGPGGGETKDGKRTMYTEDFKPNHLSVMNSAYAGGIYVDTVEGLTRVPTLAGVTMGNLDEKSLDEPSGMEINIPALWDSMRAGSTHILGEDTVTGLRVRYTCPNEGPVRWASPLGAIDWNCDGTTDDTGVEVDVNRGGVNTGVGQLVSRNDWRNVSFRGPSCPQFSLMLEDTADNPASEAGHLGAYNPLGLAPCPLHPTPTRSPDKYVSSVLSPEIPPSNFEDADGKDNDGDGTRDEGFADDDGDDIVNLIDDCPLAIDVIQYDRDSNLRGDACQGLPGPVEGLTVAYNTTTAQVRMSWTGNETNWGYNVYKIAGGNVSRLGSTFPTTTSTSFNDGAGTETTRYIVKAVGPLGDQGPGMPVLPQVDTGGGGGGGGDGGDGDPSEEGVPGPGALLSLVAVSLGALAAARRRER